MVRHYFYAAQSSYCLVGTAITLLRERRVKTKQNKTSKAAVGYSFVIKSIISKGFNFHTSDAVKPFTTQEINISFLVPS